MSTYLVIHHSSTPKDNTSLDAIRADHKQRYGRTFYNVIIDGNGLFHKEHNELNYRGSNANSYDICVIGNFLLETPSQNQIRELKKQITAYTSSFNIKSVIGHKEVVAAGLEGTQSSCPGDLLDHLKTMQINIQLIREEEDRHEQRITDALETAYDWFKARGVDIVFSNIGHIQLYTKTHPTGYNAGNYLPNSKTANVFVGDGDPSESMRTDWQAVVHEIQHAMWFEVGLGCMHDCVGQDEEVMPIKYHNAGLELVLNKALDAYDPTKHYLPLNGGGLYPPDTMDSYNKYVIMFYIATGRGLGDTEALEHWTNHANEHGLEDAFKIMLDDYIEDTHEAVHQLDNIYEE